MTEQENKGLPPLRFSNRTERPIPIKMRREQEAHTKVLMSFTNAYITFKKQHEKDKKNKFLIESEFNIQYNNWKNFVRNWNQNPKHMTALRLDEFASLITYKENLERVQYEKG